MIENELFMHVGILLEAIVRAIGRAGTCVYELLRGPTLKQKYERKKIETTQRVKSLQEQLLNYIYEADLIRIKKLDPLFIKKLNTLIDDASDAKFEMNGELAAEQPLRNKLQILRWTEKVLSPLALMKMTPFQEKNLKETIIKKIPNKLNKASRKPIVDK